MEGGRLNNNFKDIYNTSLLLQLFTILNKSN